MSGATACNARRGLREQSSTPPSRAGNFLSSQVDPVASLSRVIHSFAPSAGEPILQGCRIRARAHGPVPSSLRPRVAASAMIVATTTQAVALGGARAVLRGRRLPSNRGSSKVIQKAPAVKPRRNAVVTSASAIGTNLTTWLLRQEMERKIDGELAVVLSSVSIACKRVRSRYPTAARAPPRPIRPPPSESLRA